MKSKTVLLIFIVIFYLPVFSQKEKIENKLVYREKTGELYSAHDPEYPLIALNVYPVFAKYSSFLMEALKPDQNYIYLEDRNIESAASYLYHPKDEKYLNELFDFRVSKKVNSFARMRRPRMSSADSGVVMDEIRAMEKIFRDSAITHYTVSDTMLRVLKKYPADHHAFVEALYFKAKSLANDEFHHWTLVKLFVIDSRTRQLIFYNYCMEYGGKKAGPFTKGDVPRSCFKPIFRRFKTYCEEGKESGRKQTE